MIEICSDIHQSTNHFSHNYFQQTSHNIYITPNKYITFLKTFIQLLIGKKKKLNFEIQDKKASLNKLLSTSEEVSEMEKSLEIRKLQLIEIENKIEKLTEQINSDKKFMEEIKLKVEKLNDETREQQEITQLMTDEIKKDLDSVLPSLDTALVNLKSMDRNDIIELQNMQKPPEIIKIVIEVISIMLGVKSNKVETISTEKSFDHWESGKLLLQDPQKFINDLINYDKDNISEKVIKKIMPYIDDYTFTSSAVEKISKTWIILYQWIQTIYKYHYVIKLITPKREILNKAQQNLTMKKTALNANKENLKELENNLANLKYQKLENIKIQKKLESEINDYELKLRKGSKLIEKFLEEKYQWSKAIEKLQFNMKNIIGNMLISSGYISYLGPFTMECRENIINVWMKKLIEYNIPHTNERSLITLLGDPIKIRNWHNAGLPEDDFSIENAIICYNSQDWPLFIDPQNQANKWIKAMESSNLESIKLTDKDFLHSLDNAIRFGKPCLLENVGEKLHPSLDPLLLKQILQRGTNVIKFGDSLIPFNENFCFYITTKLSNPLFTPEIYSKVNVINFSLSSSGLEKKLLCCIMASERQDLEEAKTQLVINNAKMKSELKNFENKIIQKLSISKENILDDLELINTLEELKMESQNIKEKINTSLDTEKSIDFIRNQYMPVALRARILFFSIYDLRLLNPMYQYSLEWFIEIFLSSIANAECSEHISQRSIYINNHFMYNLFIKLHHTLFEKDRLLYAFLLCQSLLINEGQIDKKEWDFFLNGGTEQVEMDNPSPSWLPENTWKEICILAKLPKFESLPFDFYENNNYYKKLYFSYHPESENLPNKWEEKLNDFERLLLLRCIRIDSLYMAMKKFVCKHLGLKYIECQKLDLSQFYDESSCITPLILILSQGSDPEKDLYKLFEEKHHSEKIYLLSVGQKQCVRAKALFESAIEMGNWIFFQNCHLAPSWMSQLEKLIENIDSEKIHRDFRLWLSSMPSKQFPVSILQKGLKMTVESAQGIKGNLLKIYKKFNDNILECCEEKGNLFKPLLLSLCLFHSVILERCKYGSRGFNITYEFIEEDLYICINQLEMFIKQYKDVPFEILTYTAGEINYGGRILDKIDKQCIKTLLQDYYNPNILSQNHLFNETEFIHQLTFESTYEQYIEYIQSLPIIDSPNLLGLHENASIIVLQNKSYQVLYDILSLKPKTISTDIELREKIIENIAKEILHSLPDIFNEKQVSALYPKSYEESMNTVLIQEIIRYNQLLTVLNKSLNNLLKAFKGTILMNEDLEDIANNIYNNCVPSYWLSKAYPSLKNLSAWISDFLLRIKFFQCWINEGIPKVFWISGFYFPQAFLIGILQNYSRKYSVSINTVKFSFKILNTRSNIIEQFPADGGYIYGLFLEGARWNGTTLTESRPNELYTEMPVIWLLPKVQQHFSITNKYLCPVFKTLKRARIFLTVKDSRNFLLNIEIPTDFPKSHWIKRGVALICSLDF